MNANELRLTMNKLATFREKFPIWKELFASAKMQGFKPEQFGDYVQQVFSNGAVQQPELFLGHKDGETLENECKLMYNSDCPWTVFLKMHDRSWFYQKVKEFLSETGGIREETWDELSPSQKGIFKSLRADYQSYITGGRK